MGDNKNNNNNDDDDDVYVDDKNHKKNKHKIYVLYILDKNINTINILFYK
jgi:hypothetical protein